jgi:hypothetical protein
MSKRSSTALRRKAALLAGGAVACSLSFIGLALASGGASYETTSKNVPNTGAARTSATSKCGSGRHVTGGGVQVTGEAGSLELEVGQTLPAKHTGWHGGANNTSSTTAQMTVTAICEKGKFTYKTVKASIPVNKAVHKVAKCPLGTFVLGGGAGAPGDHGVEVFQTEPTDGPDKGTKLNDAWEGGVNNSSSHKTKLTVTAICADVPKRAVKKVSGPRKVLPDNTQDSATAMCPSGTHVVGGGAHTHPHSTDTEVESTFPIDGPDPDTKPDDGWEAVANNDDSGFKIDLHSIALCVA